MKTVKILMVLVLLLSLTTTVMAAGPGGGGGGGSGGAGSGGGSGGAGSGGGSGGGGETEVAGNNLSYPVIWSEGVTKVLPGTAAMTPIIAGEYWYQWGTNGSDPDVVPASCSPDPDETNTELNPNAMLFCNDLLPDSLTKPAGDPPADNPLPLARAYLQKDQYNVWQAWSGLAATADVSNTQGGVDVDWIDWGDNLESVDWYTRSQVRTEVVLFQDLPTPLLEYEMRHTSGWGIDEVHGLATDLANTPLMGPGTRATVYSNCARLTIQKLLVPRNDSRLADLIWVEGVGWTEPLGYVDNLINSAIFNKAVHEGGDGPGYYAAEINVKGRIIYGYTWNVRQVNDMTPLEGSQSPTAAGDYRLTFSLDKMCGTVSLKTYFMAGTTQILVPIETEEVAALAAEGDDVGATGVLVPAVFDPYTAELLGGNLTYMDVHILQRGRTATAGGDCECNCNCVGKECTCTCEETCDCECEDGICECGASNCVQSQAHVREMERQRTQLQSACPGDDCPCTDIEGNSCEQFRTQLTSTVNSMRQLQFQTVCDSVGCQCLCQSGDACSQTQTQLQTLMQTQEQLMTECGSGACEVDTEFFDAMSTEMAALASLLDTMDERYEMCLPALKGD